MNPIIIWLMLREHERQRNLDLGPPPIWAAYLFLLIAIGFDVAIFWDAYNRGMLW
ncbi:hypothetical protein NKK48_01730 [Mesorhizobium sp. C386A]|uniref:hypothetical protein n=1 Tax=unclassified Mesorhizobium TaxID=325217 RepID=UPI0003CE6619|nr:hypothetical protein [Mesorhizobium sp. LNJC386A00]ESY35797.1 hypothetical protein X748_14420 [Mesorhizobium sp. LNJC386A00]